MLAERFSNLGATGGEEGVGDAEIDGAGHLWGLNQTADCLRANEVALGDERVLRINVIGLRLEEDAFMDQIARGLRLGGWHG